MREGYGKALSITLSRIPLAITAAVLSLGVVYWLFKVLPTGFVPEEDQGYFMIMIRSPEGSSLQYTDDIVRKVCKLVDEQPEARPSCGLPGYGLANGNQPGVALVFCPLQPWEHRRGIEHHVSTVLMRIYKQASNILGAQVAPFNAPAIEGLGTFGGFTYELQDMYGGAITKLADAANKLIGVGNTTPGLTGLFTTFSANTPQMVLDVKRDEAERLNVDIGEILEVVQTLSGSTYVNDFDYLNRSYRVYVQADKFFRNNPDSIFGYYVPSRAGKMISLRNLLTFKPNLTAQTITHYNILRSVEINGNPAPGFSSGQAIATMDKLSLQNLPKGMTHSWTGIAYEEIQAGASALIIFALGLLFVYLVLSAQYETFVDPLIILFSVPPAMLGALFFQWSRGLQDDVFCQIGLVMLIGLASKNAILIVEFANHLVQTEKLSFLDAAYKSATLRLRPILMTSFAFIVGLLPLAVATGAGAASRQSLGTAVCGGMLVSTFISLFLVPVVYVLVKTGYARIRGVKMSPPPAEIIALDEQEKEETKVAD